MAPNKNSWKNEFLYQSVLSKHLCIPYPHSPMHKRQFRHQNPNTLFRLYRIISRLLHGLIQPDNGYTNELNTVLIHLSSVSYHMLLPNPAHADTMLCGYQ